MRITLLLFMLSILYKSCKHFFIFLDFSSGNNPTVYVFYFVIILFWLFFQDFIAWLSHFINVICKEKLGNLSNIFQNVFYMSLSCKWSYSLFSVGYLTLSSKFSLFIFNRLMKYKLKLLVFFLKLINFSLVALLTFETSLYIHLLIWRPAWQSGITNKVIEVVERLFLVQFFLQ